ncbi:MAG: DUF4214 domain-containing protein, partial [Clostridiales bacterium]|nr:DUF4214 domain-containing protein [Clostridiales bacterium]
MRSKKQIVSLILVWIMVVALFPIGHFEKLRADTTDLMTPTLAEDGTLSWDPSIRDVYFDVDGENTHYSIMGGTSYNLNDYFEEYSYRTCDTKIELYGKVGTEYQLMWSGTFHYEAKYGILGTPKNVVLTEDYVLHWDPVDNATSYRVYILDRQGNMYINDRGTISGKTELFVGHIFSLAYPHDCQLGVVAMSSKGYQKSDLAKSAVYHVTRADKRITNVKFSKDGMMTWDELEGATYYKIGIGINDKKASFTCSTNSVAIDEKIRSALPDGGAGFYTVTIQAFDDEKALSYIWEGEHDIDVVFYDLFIYGEQITSVNLDVFGDGSVVFDPQTSTLRFSCESLDELDYIGDGIEWDGKAPFVNTGMDLTITGTLIIPSGYWVTFKIFESLGKLTFVDFNFTIGGSQTRIIEAANVEFVSGTYDIVGCSNNPIRVYHDLVFRNGITSFSAAVDGTSAILVDHGKITLEGLLITCPQNGTISADGKRFLQEDGETDAPWVILKPDPNYVPPTPEPGPTTPEPGPSTPEPGPTNPNPDPTNPNPGTPDPAKDPSFEDFVERLYTVALGRASEAEGKAFWVDQVVNKGFTGADCARFFLLDAPEFLGRGLSDDEFVEILYLT